MAASADPDEPEVRADDPMLRGYGFVPKGNVYITKNYRKMTHEAEKTLYVVLDNKSKPIGLRCPTHIYEPFWSQNKATAAQRAEAVQKRDTAIENNFGEAVLKLFPKIPKAEVPLILKHALKKHSRRVGRASKVAFQDKVKLAVRAHIRHVHTDYDMLLKQGTSRLVAREKWGGRPLNPTTLTPATEKQAKKSKTMTTSTRKSQKTASVKKAIVRTALGHRMLTRRMSRDASELSSGSRESRTGAVSRAHTGLRVRTRQMTSGSDLLAIDDEGLAENVHGFPEDPNVQYDVFTRSDGDYDSDCSE
ncbi:hypothetical protein C8A03DRAFT_44848 [Achaetomium macrosporum]|uniref:DUF2293 domain-containing protein n=1 Tax=Achaetomium macrosporum TaxID=79813 RepID=A0AAN7HDB8_9PEZI|nr:hypothetical protein C8A03DRAFT_44848 [Achaetomium macrosporum]